MQITSIVLCLAAAVGVLGSRESKARAALSIVGNHAWDKGMAADKARTSAEERGDINGRRRADQQYNEAHRLNNNIKNTYKDTNVRRLGRREIESELYARGWNDAYEQILGESLNARGLDELDFDDYYF